MSSPIERLLTKPIALIRREESGTEDEWVAEVAEHFAGTIVLAEDLTAVEVPSGG